MDVISAEAKMVDLVIELNLPMSSLDKFSKGVKKMFHDSKIAKSFQCARSKGTAIAKEMSAMSALDLIGRMKTQCFTISTDGSNDRGGEKLFPFVVRTINPDTKEVRSDALAVPAIEGSATGVKIFSLIEDEFNAHSIPWENCLALGSDNANVMVGKQSGLYGCKLKKQPQLYLSGCVCHLIHIAAEKGAGCLPFSPSQLLVEVFYYLDKSSKRLADLKCCQLLYDIKECHILKHVATRWLSIGKCLPRLIASWEALYHFFKEEESTLKDGNAKKKVRDLKTIFVSRTNKLYCMFLLHAVKNFESVNTELQCDSPIIHKLQGKLRKLFKETLLTFVKPSAIIGQDILEVDFQASSNIKSNQDIIIGDPALEVVLGNSLKPEKVDVFYGSVISFYQSACTYMKKKLPLSEPLLQHITITDPTQQQNISFTNMLFFLSKFPQLLGNATLTDIQTEFSIYQCTDIQHITKQTDRADTAWFQIGERTEDGQPLLNYLPKIMLSLLTIPHSSAHCERIFSVVRKNRTDQRGNMSRETLEALVVAKSRPGEALERTYTPKELQNLKSAYYRSLQA